MSRRPRRPGSDIEAAPVVTARVRQYRRGLGDCLLLTLLHDGEPTFRMMIDCGVYQTTWGGKAKVLEVVKDVIQETGGFVDVLVATHEHWDHVSGFNQAHELFATPDEGRPCGKLSVGQVWLGWTEDPDDPAARQLESERASALTGLAAAHALAGQHLGMENLERGLGSVLDFFGANRTTKDALETVRKLSGSPVRHCRPSDAPWTGVQGVRIYALGPPLDTRAIYQLMVEGEVYHLSARGFGAAALVDLLVDRQALTDCDLDPAQPFDLSQRLAMDFATPGAPELDAPSEADRFLRAHYLGPGSDEALPDQAWRRIDADWLGSASDLALKLDNATNNTSLVLALEFVASGKVLLFAADAQVGSWLTWADLSWTLSDSSVVRGEELLRKVVLYKVGHHGSHNATLRGRGLEMMTSSDLVALIPVDEVLAKKVGWGRMPLPALTTALDQRARGRVLRTDRDYTADHRPETQAFAGRLKQDKLFYEIEVGP